MDWWRGGRRGVLSRSCGASRDWREGAEHEPWDTFFPYARCPRSRAERRLRQIQITGGFNPARGPSAACPAVRSVYLIRPIIRTLHAAPRWRPARSLRNHQRYRRWRKRPRPGERAKRDEPRCVGVGPHATQGRRHPSPFRSVPMALSPGTRLGPYEIINAIGAGGMGEVYKARDTRLERTVAVKVLPDALQLGRPIPRALRARSEEHLRAQSPEHLHALRRRAVRTASTSSSWSTSRARRWRRDSRKGALPLADAMKIGDRGCRRARQGPPARASSIAI